MSGLVESLSAELTRPTVWEFAHGSGWMRWKADTCLSCPLRKRGWGFTCPRSGVTRWKWCYIQPATMATAPFLNKLVWAPQRSFRTAQRVLKGINKRHFIMVESRYFWTHRHEVHLHFMLWLMIHKFLEYSLNWSKQSQFEDGTTDCLHCHHSLPNLQHLGSLLWT